MTSSNLKGTLFLPSHLTTPTSQAFAYQVILAASIAGINIDVVSEETEHPDSSSIKAYGTPLLILRDSNNTNMYLNQSKAAIQAILNDSENLLSLNTLSLDDKLNQFFFNEKDELESIELTNLSKVHKVLLFGILKSCEIQGKDVPSSYKTIYDELNNTHQTALSVLNNFVGFISERRIKDGIEFNYDWSEERLPKNDRKNVLITAALPYVNNVPHLGNIIGAVLSADAFARYCRLRGYQTLYICGTDEYGTATETKALEEGISCADLCSKYYKLHAGIYDWFGVSTDIFGRSSTSKQTAITHEIFNSLYKNGYFFEQSVEQTFCEKCNRFLADRYVEGTCPTCNYGDARGDQCDGCGKLLNPTELKDPKCKVCRSTPVVRSSNHLFLDLTKLQGICEGFVDKQSVNGKWSTNSTSISKAWLAEGLKPRCMTRDLRWGTPVPIEGFEEKVFYVWFDACFGYISITANYTDEWRQWWQSNDEGRTAKVNLYQFMGKDNVPFHTVIFPSTLLGTVDPNNDNSKCPWTLLHHINTTEYLNYEQGKFSKSRGIGVFGNDARDSGIPSSVWRYYLLSVRPETMDSVFSWDDFGAKNNNELLANLGNFVSRVTKFTVAKFEGKIPKLGELNEIDQKLISSVNGELGTYIEQMEGVHLKSALKTVMAISSLGNLYLTESSLDNKLLQKDPARCSTIIAVSINLIYLLSAVLEPFIPSTSEDIRKILNVPSRTIPDVFDPKVILEGHVLGKPFHLFSRIEESKLAEFRAKFAGKQVK